MAKGHVGSRRRMMPAASARGETGFAPSRVHTRTHTHIAIGAVGAKLALDRGQACDISAAMACGGPSLRLTCQSGLW